MKIQFKVENQIIKRIDHKRVVADSRNYLYAEFSFSDEWNGIITAIFKHNETAYEQILNEYNCCLVPFEVITEGEFSVSCVCGDRVTANKEYISVEQSGYEEGETPSPPSPDVYSQLVELCKDAVETADSVREDADAGKFDGKDGKDGEKGEKGDPGEYIIGNTMDATENVLNVKNGGVNTPQLAAGGVTKEKLSPEVDELLTNIKPVKVSDFITGNITKSNIHTFARGIIDGTTVFYQACVAAEDIVLNITNCLWYDAADFIGAVNEDLSYTIKKGSFFILQYKNSTPKTTRFSFPYANISGLSTLEVISGGNTSFYCGNLAENIYKSICSGFINTRNIADAAITETKLNADLLEKTKNIRDRFYPESSSVSIFDIEAGIYDVTEGFTLELSQSQSVYLFEGSTFALSFDHSTGFSIYIFNNHFFNGGYWKNYDSTNITEYNLTDIGLIRFIEDIVGELMLTEIEIETDEVGSNTKKTLHVIKTDEYGNQTEYVSEEYNSDDVVSGITGVVIDEVNNDTSQNNNLTAIMLRYANDTDFQKGSKNASGKIYFRALEAGNFSLTFDGTTTTRQCKANDIIVCLIDFTYSIETGAVVSYDLRLLSVISFLDNNGNYYDKTEVDDLIAAIELPTSLDDIFDESTGKTARDEVEEMLTAENVSYDDSLTYYDCNNLQALMDKLAFDLGYRIVEQDGTPEKILEAVEAGVAEYTFALGDVITIPRYVGTTKETIYRFRVVDYDNAELVDSTVRHSMTLMSRYVVTSITFDTAEATYFAAEALPAGNYWFKYNNNTNLQFTTTQDIPAGGLVKYVYAGSGGAAGSITTYRSCMLNSDGSRQTIESGLALTAGNTGTELTPVNNLDRTRYGNNRYLYSDAKKFINSERDHSEHSWQPDAGRNWCFEPAWSLTTDGFLCGMPPEWKAIFAYHLTTVAKPGTDGGGFEKIAELVSLPTLTQMYGGTNNGISEGQALRYYAEGSTLSAPGTAADSFRKQYSTSGSASGAWTASAYTGNANSSWNLSTAGQLSGNSAYISYGLVPLVTIARTNPAQSASIEAE